MSNYNLIKSGLINTNNLGTKYLNSTQLSFLYDGNTTTSGIDLIVTDTLYLDIDLYNRIDVKEFKLYIDVPDRPAALTKVNFYYKNLVEENYILCSKGQDEFTFYPVGLPELFAPRFCRITIDLLECTIFEVVLLNSSDQVAFGADGNESSIVMDYTYDNYTTLPIFNNATTGSVPVNAYVMVDYQEKESDFYLTLSSSIDGEYKGLEDGALIKTDDSSFKYTWSKGKFNGTMVVGDNIQVDPNNYGTSYYYYTTPVVSLGDPLMSSFLITRRTTNSGTSITWGNPEDASLVKIRSFNTAPVSFTKFFISNTLVDKQVLIYEGDLATGEFDNNITIYSTSVENNSIIFDQHSGTFVMLLANDKVVRLKYHVRGDTSILASSSSDSNNKFNEQWGLDGVGNVWGYVSNSGYKLRFLTSDTLVASTVLIDEAISFVTDLSPNILYPSCWFTDSSVRMLKQVDPSGELLVSKPMNNPTYVTSLYDGGCLVVDEGLSTIFRVNYSGETIFEIHYPSIYEIIDIEYNLFYDDISSLHERFWVLTSDGHVFQSTLEGVGISDTRYTLATSIHAFLGGCLVHCSASNRTYQLNSDGIQTRIWDYSGLSTMGLVPCPVSLSYDKYLDKYKFDTLLPLPSDPLWENVTEQGWQEVKDDGYLLPFAQYHQLKYKFNPIILEVPITNSDFETGDLTGWQTSGTGWYASGDNVYQGAYKARLIHTSWATGYLYQTLSLDTINSIDFDLLDFDVQGYIFNLNFWFYWTIATDWSYYAKISLYFYSQAMQEIVDTSVSVKYGAPGGDNRWYNKFIQAKLPSGTRYVKIEVFNSKYRYDSTYDAFDSFRAHLVHSPVLSIVGVPEPVKLQDIAPQTSKNVYLKTNFPVNTVDKDYKTRLKCWWGTKEE